MSAEFRGTRYYVAWGVAERGPLFRLRSAEVAEPEKVVAKLHGAQLSRAIQCPLHRLVGRHSRPHASFRTPLSLFANHVSHWLRALDTGKDYFYSRLARG